MKSPVLLVLLFLGGPVFEASAQISDRGPEQWQLTFDVVKSKAEGLMVMNNVLQRQNASLNDQLKELRHAIIQQRHTNEQTALLAKERHGRTDQQMRLDELTQGIKEKRQKARDFNDVWEKLNRRKSAFSKEPAPKPGDTDEQLAPWRKQLEEESRQEVLLENQLKDIKSGAKYRELDLNRINRENKELESTLDGLRSQQKPGPQGTQESLLIQSNDQRYQRLKERKEQLESQIRVYESRLGELRESSLSPVSWPARKKQLVHEMVNADARNNKMRDKIKVLQQDIDVLRDQVAKLERRVNFEEGKSAGGQEAGDQ